MPREELIHESRGLRIHKNPKNHFVVCRLHYTADPAKRSRAWEDEARSGLSPEQFDREYNISYDAMLGEKVFPEITSNRDKIVLKPPYPEWSKDQPFWAGFDYGSRNPSSFHVYTIDDDCIYSIFELFEPCKNIPEFCKKLKECEYYPYIRYIASDPTIFDKRTHDAFGNPTSVANLMTEQGITKLLAGNNNEDTFVAEVRRRWADRDDVRFRIYDSCPNMIREFETAIYPVQSERVLQSNNQKERMSDVNNHALDDCKYFFNSRPRRVPRTVKWPRMVERWRH